MRNRIRNREGGFIVSTELMLIATILVIGLVVGLQAVRTSVVTELADVGEAIGAVSQTYLINGVTGHHASSNGSTWQDLSDTCDTTDAVQSGTNSRCVVICDAANSPAPDGENAAPLTFSP